MAQENQAKTPSHRQPAGSIITIGRRPDSDVVLDYPMISWDHARLIASGGGWVLEDLNSTNGTSVGHAANRISRAEVSPTDSVFFGSFKIRVSRLIEPEQVVLGDSPQEPLRFTGTQMMIGRDPGCDYPLSFPTISWHHAKLQRTAQGIEIDDLDSRNGTFVDGQRITQRVLLKVGSEVALGSFRFTLLDESGNFARRDYKGNVTIEASEIVVEIHRGSVHRRLLDPVSLTIYPSELVALMGPAGAGKTTLLKALNGYTPPNSGRILFNGSDLYAHQDQFRLQIGYVPQDDILHPQLTVKEALYYTARLRTDLRDSEIEARVMQVLTDLGIEDIGDRLIGSPEKKVISGGQRKRVNIAMELLSDPSVLFLDEPTSGLSSHDAFQVMQLLRTLADGGKTIVTTIHQPSLDIFRQFDSLIMVARDKGNHPGMLVYFGPAYPESIDFFNPEMKNGSTGIPEMLMSGLALQRAGHWAGLYERSSFKKLFVESRRGRVVSTKDKQAPGTPKRELGLGQWSVLSARNAKLRVRDRVQTMILLGQAPLFALLLVTAFGRVDDAHFTEAPAWASFCGKLSSIHFLMVVAAVWFGCNNASRDFVGETAIFLRERMINLKLPSYVFSKLTVLSVICIFQCTSMLAITYFACHLSGPFPVELAVLVASSLVGSAIGLFISAISPTTESAIAFLPVVLLPFILLAGGIRPLNQMPKPAQWVAAVCPTRWGYEANFLQEAAARKTQFKNTSVARLSQPGERSPAPVPEVLSDVAESAFPTNIGRSSLGRSFQVLAASFTALLILILSALGLKANR
jgi:ABC-type multidrug transport system ATPase subunit